MEECLDEGVVFDEEDEEMWIELYTGKDKKDDRKCGVKEEVSEKNWDGLKRVGNLLKRFFIDVEDEMNDVCLFIERDDDSILNNRTMWKVENMGSEFFTFLGGFVNIQNCINFFCCYLVFWEI